MLTFVRQPAKEKKVSVAGRAPIVVKRHINAVAKKYNTTPSHIICEILVAWHNGEEFQKKESNKMASTNDTIRKLKTELSLRRDSIIQFIRKDVAEPGSEEAWANSYNDVFEKMRKKRKNV